MFTIPNGTSNADLQAQVDAVDWQIIEQGIRGDGVGTTTDLAVTQHVSGGPNMSVDIASGTASIGNVITAAVAGQTGLVIGANSSGNPRFDLVCVDTTGTVSVTAGATAAAPVFPAIPALSLVLAAVYVPTGATSITTARITDKRTLRSGMAWNKVTVTSNYTASAGDWVFVNAASGDVTVTSPNTFGSDVLVTRTDDVAGGHTVTVAATAGGVDGGTETLGAQYQSFWMRGDGTGVRIIGERRPFGTPGRLGGPVSAGTSTRTLRADAVFDTKMVRNPQLASYTLVLTDADNKVVEMDLSLAGVLTIPPASSVAWVDGTTIEVYQKGAGQVTVTAGAGVTLRAPNGTKTTRQFSSAGLRYRGSDEWVLTGDTTT